MFLALKVQLIKRDISQLIRTVCKEKFWVTSYGAYNIHPKHLVFWICVQTDREKQKLISDAALMDSLRTILETRNYPINGRSFVHIGFESEETVARESDGNWLYHFQ